MEIIWRRAALNDLEAIRQFIAQDNAEAADSVRAAIGTAVSQLADYPDLGRAGRIDRTRELTVPHMPYIVAYSVAENQIRIVAIIHTSR